MKFISDKLLVGHFMPVVFMLLLFAKNCNAQENKNNELIKEITGITWIHSYEDDEGELTVYRPQEYNFPPSRGRQGFRMDSDGSFILYGIAPTDGMVEHKGKWKNENGIIKVTFEGKKQDLNFGPIQLISQKEGVLKINKLEVKSQN